MLLMKCYQLDLFRDFNDLDEIRQDLTSLEVSHSKVRRRLFAENAKLYKLTLELADRIEKLEGSIHTDESKLIAFG